jgi:AcrR family transcriptional regulator
MILEQTLTRKDQIYQVAERLFSERGYHATTIRELARELQIEGGSLYSHISSKQSLLYDIVLRSSEQFLRAAHDVLAAGGPAQNQLRTLMRRHMSIIAASTDRAVVYFHEWKHLDPPYQDVIKRHRNEYEGVFRQIIRTGVANGEFAPNDEGFTGLQALSLLNWTYQWYRTDGRLSAEELADHFFELVMCGLRVKG